MKRRTGGGRGNGRRARKLNKCGRISILEQNVKMWEVVGLFTGPYVFMGDWIYSK